LAQIALPLYLAFLIVALKRDFKEHRSVSSALWIPFLWIADCATKPLDLWLFPHQAVAFSQRIAWEQRLTGIEVFQSNPLERIFFIVLMVAGLIVLSKRMRDFSFRLKENAGVAIFFLYALVSVSWSDYQGLAIKRWIRLVGDLIMVMIILTEASPRDGLDQILRRFAILFIPLSIVLIKYNETIGRIYTTYGRQMWIGVTGHKNQLGQLCAICGIFLLRRLLNKWPRIDPLDAFLFLLTAYLIVGSDSETAVMISSLGFLMVFILFFLKGDTKKFRRVTIFSFIFALALQGVSIAFFNTSVMDLFFSSTGRDASFTGRVPLWQELIRIGRQRPILGSGYGSFWSSRAVYGLWEKVHWTPVSSHNGYIDIFMNLGLIGLLALFIFLFYAYRNISRSIETDREFGNLNFVFFIVILIQNIMEATLSVANSFLWILILMTSVLITRRPAQGDEEPGDTFSRDRSASR
jgi:exopolysaccharide production protein ExoQ